MQWVEKIYLILPFNTCGCQDWAFPLYIRIWKWWLWPLSSLYKWTRRLKYTSSWRGWIWRFGLHSSLYRLIKAVSTLICKQWRRTLALHFFAQMKKINFFPIQMEMITWAKRIFLGSLLPHRKYEKIAFPYRGNVQDKKKEYVEKETRISLFFYTNGQGRYFLFLHFCCLYCSSCITDLSNVSSIASLKKKILRNILCTWLDLTLFFTLLV